MELTNVTVEPVEENVLMLVAEVPAGEVDLALNQVYHEFSRRVTLPGFRKGKIPREILRQRLGRDAIRQEAINRLLQPAYETALDRSGVQPIDQVSVEVVEFDESGPFKFRTKVITKPSLELGDYEHFETEKPHYEVTEEQVDLLLQDQQHRHAQFVDSGDRGIQRGDVVWGMLEVTIAGEETPREATAIRPFVIGENNLVPSLDNHSLGLRAGEVAQFTVTYPEDYANSELANRSGHMKFEIVGFRERQLPELNDAFAQQLGKYETLEDLRNEIRQLLEKDADARASKELQDELVSQAVERSKLDLPSLLVDKRVERRLHNVEHDLEKEKMSLEVYLETQGTNLEEFRSRLRQQVERDLRKQFVLGAIASRENLAASREEMEAQIAAMAKALDESPTVLRQRLERTGTIKLVEESVLERKASHLIMERAGLGAPPGDEPDGAVKELIDATSSQQAAGNQEEEGRS